MGFWRIFLLFSLFWHEMPPSKPNNKIIVLFFSLSRNFVPLCFTSNVLMRHILNGGYSRGSVVNDW